MNAFDAGLIEDAAIELAVGPGLVEKEWYAVRIVEIVSRTVVPPLVPLFAGGTSLSTAHGLTSRFSEDVDFKISKSSGQFRPATADDISRFLNKAKPAILEAGYRELEDLARQDRQFGFQRCCFEYDPRFSATATMRPHVQLEITPVDEGASTSRTCNIFTRVSRLAQSVADIEDVPCVEIVDTAADKISALTWRVLVRTRGAPRDDTSLVRHVYDLAALAPDVSNTARFRNLCIQRLHQDGRQQRSKGRIDPVNPVDSVQEMRRVLSNDPEYTDEYDKFIADMAFDRDPPPPTFDEALQMLDILIESLSR